MGWLIAFAILFMLSVLPLGVQVYYQNNQLKASVVLGVLRVGVYPLPKRLRRQKTGAKANPSDTVKEEPKKQPSEENKTDFTAFYPFIKLGLDFLDAFRRKLRINQLDVKVIMAGDDPCDLAIIYGRAQAAAVNLIAVLENVFVIKKRNVEVECDFTANATILTAKAKLTITFGRLISLAAVYSVRTIKEFLTLKKKREKAVQTQ